MALDQKLIELVRSKPELYDMNSVKYIDSSHKTKVWEDIGAILNKTGSECKQRWISLRSQHRKVMQKQQANIFTRKWKFEKEMEFLKDFMKDKSKIVPFNTENSSDEGKTEKVNDTIKIERADLNCQVESDEKSEESFVNVMSSCETAAEQMSFTPLMRMQVYETSTPTSPPSKKQKLQETVTSTVRNYPFEQFDGTEERDGLDLFLLSMASTIKTFSPYDQHTIKTKIFNIVADMEARYLKPDSPPVTVF